MSVVPINKAEHQVSVKNAVFHYFSCMGVFSPTRLQYSSYVDFVTICTEYRVLSLQADFRTTKERRLLMAHKLRSPTEAYNAQVSLCDDRKWFASVCIEHGVFQSRR